jgi:hypothetical protein
MASAPHILPNFGEGMPHDHDPDLLATEVAAPIAELPLRRIILKTVMVTEFWPRTSDAVGTSDCCSCNR